MPKKTPGQQSLDDYKLEQVDVRLCLKEASPLYSMQPISSPESAAKVMADMFRELDREYCCVINMDNQLRPINFNIVSIGSLNQSIVPIQNVFKSAILSNAGSVMMMHNHPSGVVKPSQEDFNITKRLVEAGKLMDIPVMDHIIIGGGTGEQYSFRTKNPELFSGAPDLSFIQNMNAERNGGVAELKTDYVAVKHGFPKPDQLMDYEQVKDALFLRVMNRENNEAKIAGMPHRTEGDIALTYHIRVDVGDARGVSSTPVTNELLSRYGITEEQLHEDAMQSAPEVFPVQFMSMASLMRNMMRDDMLAQGLDPEDVENFIESYPDDPNNSLMVLTNSERVNGASALFYPDQMEAIAEEMNGNFFVLPSSIHEVIILPDDGSMSYQELENMVSGINAAEVRPEEQLSDRVYRYDAVERVFELAESHEQRMAARDEKPMEKDSILKRLAEKKQEAQALNAGHAAVHRDNDLSL